MYRSAGWPCLDVVEIELLAAGLLERLQEDGGHERLRVTDTGIQFLAGAAMANRQSKDAHEGLVDRIAQDMLKEGRLVWTNLSLRAKVTLEDQEDGHWKYCMPDVFSIRNSSVQSYLEPIVHEIKVSRADLLGDLKRPAKRAAYLGMASACWYVLGHDARGRPIAQPEEVPPECGVMYARDGELSIAREAPRRAIERLPFHVWMTLAQTEPAVRLEESGQARF